MSKKNKQSDYLQKLSASQNFITSGKLLHRIVNLSSITRQDTVIEIGTGKGHLTRALCQKCGFLYSIEIDRKLYQHAKERLAGCQNLKLIQGDFLDYQLPTGTDYKVFANIPYFITTQIIRKLTETTCPPADLWLIMEKGAAKRFTGRPRETTQSLLLKTGWDMKILYHFQKNDFHPMPSVNSVLLHLSRKQKPDLARKDLPEFRQFITHSMKYGLYGRRSLLTKKQVGTALRLANLPPLKPGGETLYIQWLCLFQCYRKMK